MKLIKHFLREGKFLDKGTRYFLNAVQYNKGIALDAYYFNLFTPEMNDINQAASKIGRKIKSAFPKIVFRLLLVFILSIAW